MGLHPLKTPAGPTRAPFPGATAFSLALHILTEMLPGVVLTHFKIFFVTFFHFSAGQRGKGAEGSGGAAEAEAAGGGEQSQAAGGRPAPQGERRAPPAGTHSMATTGEGDGNGLISRGFVSPQRWGFPGGSQIVPHPREPGGAHRGVPGQPPQLQLRHRQGGPRGQAHPAVLTGRRDGTLNLSPLPLPQSGTESLDKRGLGKKGKGNARPCGGTASFRGALCPPALVSCSRLVLISPPVVGLCPELVAPPPPGTCLPRAWHKRRVPAAPRGVSAPPVNLVCDILSKNTDSVCFVA